MTPTGSTGCPISSEPANLLSIDDLTDHDVVGLLSAARSYVTPTSVESRRAPFIVGLVFLEPSLRTRVGFAVAAGRLGGTFVNVIEPRFDPGMTEPESFADTLRTVSGMVEVVVVRVPFLLKSDALEWSARPMVNGGDAGEHPTQALIDLFAIQQQRGPVADLRICICGDLGSRTARSLLKLLDRFPPRRLTLVAPPGRDDPGLEATRSLAARTDRQAELDVSKIDVLYLPGLPEGGGPGRLTAKERQRYSLTRERLAELPFDTVVLSPMPVIDEIARAVRHDPRIGMFRQSDAGVAVRMAVLGMVLQH